MPLTNAGRDFIAGAITGAGTFFSNVNSRIGVGDGATAFAVAQTDLVGTNKTRQGMEAGYPQVSGNTITFRSSFGSAVANHAWSEWALFSAATGGTMLSRKVENLGTKTSGTWVLTVSLTINI